MATIEQTTEVGGRPPADGTAVTATTRTPPTTGVTNTKLGDVAVPVVRLPVLRRVHRRRTCSTAAGPARPGPTPKDVFDIPFTSVTSFILLMSSLTMVLALAAIQRGDYRRFRIWILATALFGATFIGGQIFEFTEFYPRGPRRSTRTSSGRRFFVLTGFHGAHVTIGIIWLLSLWGLSMQSRLAPGDSETGRDRRASTGTSSTSCGS